MAKIKTLVVQPVDPLNSHDVSNASAAGVSLQSYDLSRDKLTIQASAGSTGAFAALWQTFSHQKSQSCRPGDIKRDRSLEPICIYRADYSGKIKITSMPYNYKTEVQRYRKYYQSLEPILSKPIPGIHTIVFSFLAISSLGGMQSGQLSKPSLCSNVKSATK